MGRMRRPAGLTLLVTAMLVLLPLLAITQYRWVGQLSDAERERLQRNLHATTGDFTRSLDLEIARAVVGLQVDAATLDDADWTRYAEKYAAWRSITVDPAVVADVFVADLPGTAGTVRLRRWDAAQRVFAAAEWPAGLAAVRTRVEGEARAFSASKEPPSARPSDLLSPDGRALVMPVASVAPMPPEGISAKLRPRFSYTIVQLDRAHIDREVLPELVARHFGPQGSLDYHVAIVEQQDPTHVIFESEAGDAARLAVQADIKEGFFGMGRDHFGLIRRAAASLRSTVPAGTPPERRLFYSVFSRSGPSAGPPPRSADGTRWLLLVRHRAGSLEAAVERARARNLGLSFGLLLLMATSVGLIALAARRAQALARQQIEFVAGVSHELRTPVSVIGAAADNLAQGVVSDPSRVRQYGSTIQTEARRLGETVERVLQFAGIQAGRAAPDPSMVKPETVIREALAASASVVEPSGAHIEVSVPEDLPLVFGDRVTLRSAVQNLVINAVKYGGPRPSVQVSARVGGSRRRPEVEIRVRDRGLGIPQAEHARIFEPFYRGTAALSRQIQGNGLGLSIVRTVVEAHGGRVTLQSAPGEGSTFAIALPVASATEAPHDDRARHRSREASPAVPRTS